MKNSFGMWWSAGGKRKYSYLWYDINLVLVLPVVAIISIMPGVEVQNSAPCPSLNLSSHATIIFMLSVSITVTTLFFHFKFTWVNTVTEEMGTDSICKCKVDSNGLGHAGANYLLCRSTHLSMVSTWPLHFHYPPRHDGPPLTIYPRPWKPRFVRTTWCPKHRSLARFLPKTDSFRRRCWYWYWCLAICVRRFVAVGMKVRVPDDWWIVLTGIWWCTFWKMLSLPFLKFLSASYRCLTGAAMLHTPSTVVTTLQNSCCMHK